MTKNRANGDDCPSRDENTADKSEWCEMPGCVRPVTFHPGGLHLTVTGREFATAAVRPSYLRLVSGVSGE
jgi:hypothetical protein